jgi:hypothetical protein
VGFSFLYFVINLTPSSLREREKEQWLNENEAFDGRPIKNIFGMENTREKQQTAMVAVVRALSVFPRRL